MTRNMRPDDGGRRFGFPQFWFGRRSGSGAAANVGGAKGAARAHAERLEERVLFVAPTAVLVNAPPNSVAGQPYVFSVRYQDVDGSILTTTIDSFDVLSTGPGGINALATLQSITSNGPANVLATYTLPFSPLAGTYTLTTEPFEVQDTNGEFVPVQILGTFNQPTGGGTSTDTIAPTAVLTGTPAADPAGLGFNFDVTYTDENDIVTQTIGNGDVRVTGPNGYSQLATLRSVDNVGQGLRVAHYQVPTPLVQGTYTATMVTQEVADLGGNFVPAGVLGTFQAGLVPPTGGTGGGGGINPDFFNPDATAVPVDVPEKLATGRRGTATVRVSNLGDTQSKARVEVSLFLSDNNVFGSADPFLAKVTTKRIRGGTSLLQKVTFRVPDVPAGNFFLFAQADPAGKIPEVNEGNNTQPSVDTVAVSVPFIDLTADLRGDLPDEVVGGTGGRLTVRVGNEGTAVFNRTAAIQLFASSNDTLDVTDRALTTIERQLNIMPNGRTDVGVNFTYPADLADGSYRIFARVDTGNQIVDPNLNNNVDASGDTVFIRRSFVDLRAVSVAITDAPLNRTQNTAAVTVENLGNVTATGSFSIQLAAVSTNPVSDVPLVKTVHQVSIAPGRSQRFLIPFRLLASLPGGSYSFRATVDADQQFSETNESNNVATTVNPFLIP